MKLNAKSDYALRAMIDLARRPGEQTTLGEIAGRQHIPETVLPGIIHSLARAGLIETVRGYGGGVRLERRADQVTVQMVIEAMEGPLRLFTCQPRRLPCPLGLGRHCPMRTLWQKTQARVLELWSNTSLADLVHARQMPTRGVRKRAGGKRAASALVSEGA